MPKKKNHISKPLAAEDLVAEFESLVISRCLKQGSKKYNQLRQHYVFHEFDAYFGEASKLQNWQRLCVDLNIEPLPDSINKCRKALNRCWVNIYDFIDAVRAGGEVKHWKSEAALAEYTIRTKKIFPKHRAKECGPVGALLARIF